MPSVFRSNADDLPGRAVDIYNLISAYFFDRVPTLHPRIDRLAGAKSDCVNGEQVGRQSGLWGTYDRPAIGAPRRPLSVF